MCCKLENIVELDKPSRTWCKDCTIGKGCNIYPDRPNSCKTFRCMWLDDPAMPENMRPDKIGAYAVDNGEYIKVVVDIERQGYGYHGPIIYWVCNTGKHVITASGHSLHFIPGKDKEMPRMLSIDWVL